MQIFSANWHHKEVFTSGEIGCQRSLIRNINLISSLWYISGSGRQRNCIQEPLSYSYLAYTIIESICEWHSIR